MSLTTNIGFEYKKERNYSLWIERDCIKLDRKINEFWLVIQQEKYNILIVPSKCISLSVEIGTRYETSQGIWTMIIWTSFIIY